jgi:hypothetical protein
MILEARIYNYRVNVKLVAKLLEDLPRKSLEVS